MKVSRNNFAKAARCKYATIYRNSYVVSLYNCPKFSLSSHKSKKESHILEIGDAGRRQYWAF